MIGTLVVKDLKLFFRNRFFAVITGLSLIGFSTIYFLIPSQVDETIGIAIFLEDPAASFMDEALNDNADYAFFTTEAEMLAALEETNDYFVGLSVPAEATAAMQAGEEVTLTSYYAPGIAAETREIFDDVLGFVANASDPERAARFDKIERTSVTLGNDIYDTPISMRDRILPMILLFIMSVEVLGLATLIIREVERGTVRALITGPLRLHQFFTAKALTGLILAFGQLLIIIAITGKITTSPLLLITTLFLGSLMIVGVGFLVAAAARDNMGVMAWGVLVLLLFGLPGIAILLPGLATGWMELIPSFFLADSLHRILNFEANWADVGRNLTLLAAIGLAMIAVGAGVLRRRF